MGCLRQKEKDYSLEMKTGGQKQEHLFPFPPGLCASSAHPSHIALCFSAEAILPRAPNQHQSLFLQEAFPPPAS